MGPEREALAGLVKEEGIAPCPGEVANQGAPSSAALGDSVVVLSCVN